MDVFRMVGSVALEGADKVGSQLSTLDSKGKASSKVFDALNKASKALAVGVGAVSASLAVMVNKTAQATDRVDKMSQKIGMSRKAYQEWDYILGQNGISVDGLQMSMKTLATQVESASKGNATAIQTFKKLGIEIRDVNGNIKDQETLFNETFSALASYGNETERTAMASTLLGRSATELAPAMNIGAEAISDLRDRAYDLGLVLSDDVIDAGVEFGDLMDDVKRSLSALTSNAMLPLMKVLSQITDKALGAFTKIQPKLVEFADIVSKVALTVPVMWSFMSGAVGLLSDKLKEKLKGPTDAILGFAESVIGWIDESGLKDAVSTVWSFTLTKLGEGWDFLTDTAVPWIGATVATVWNMTLSLLGSAFTWFETYAMPWLGKTASTIWNWTVDLSQAVTPVVMDTVSTLWSWTVEVVGETYEALKKGFETNDWSDLFGVAIDLSKTALKIAIGWAGVSALAGALITGIQNGLAGLGVAVGAIGKLGTGGTLALLSVGVALAEAVNEGGEAWGAFAANMGLAIVAGLTAGWLTKSPTVGVWTASILLNFKVGETVASAVKRAFNAYEGSDESKIEIDTIIRAPEGLVTEYGAFNAAKKKLTKIWGLETGREILAGLGVGLADIDIMGEGMARDLLQSVRDALEIKSPSRKFFDIAMHVIQGFINGMKDKYPELAELAETLMADLSSIWMEQEEVAEEVADGVVDEITDPKRKSKVFAFFKDMGKGIWNGLKGAWDFTKGIWNAVDDFEWSWSNIWNGVKDIAVDTFFAIDAGMHKMLEGMTKMPEAFMTFGRDLVSSLLGSIVNETQLWAGLQGFTQGAEKYRKYDEEGNPEEGMTASMLGGGIAGFVMGLAQQSEQFQSLVEKLQPIIDMIINLFGRLIEPLLPLVDVLGNMLQPLLKALEPLIDVIGEMLFDMIGMLMQFIPPLIAILTPILQLVVWTLETIVMPVMKFIYKALAMVYNTIANAINSLIRGINKVPGINIKWRMPTMEENMPEYQRPAESSYDVDEEEAKSSSGGTQVSEITGPTRDLFVNLLSPLASLNSLTSIGNRIYDLLDERLGSPLGVNIGEINIYGNSDVNAEALADELEEILAGRMAFAMGGNA